MIDKEKFAMIICGIWRCTKMKTISEVAKSIGVSRQAVYNAVKKSGMTLDSLTSEKYGNTRAFDDNAVKKIKALFDRRTNKNLSDNDRKVNRRGMQIGTLKKELKIVKQEKENLFNENEKLKEIIVNLSETIRMQEERLTGTERGNTKSIKKEMSKIERVEREAVQSVDVEKMDESKIQNHETLGSTAKEIWNIITSEIQKNLQHDNDGDFVVVSDETLSKMTGKSIAQVTRGKKELKMVRMISDKASRGGKIYIL